MAFQHDPACSAIALNSSRRPSFSDNASPDQVERMTRNSMRASNFLEAISYKGRLMILCNLASGEQSVTKLEGLLSSFKAFAFRSNHASAAGRTCDAEVRGQDDLLPAD